MDEQLRNGLLTHAIQAYEIGYLILGPDMTIRKGNHYVNRWLEIPLDYLIGQDVTEGLPELVGVGEVMERLREGDPPFRLEEIYRPSADGLGEYFDIQIICLGGSSDHLLLTTADVTRKARQELLLQQQRNEVQLLSAELTIANERLSYMLNRLVPTTVAKLMMSNRRMPEPGGELVRDATILFADMRDFTAVAEVYPPSATLDFLNTYLSVVAEAILRHEGSLIQLVGDMVMGVFNVPEDQPDHPTRGVRAALDIQESLQAFNASVDTGFPPVSFGIGISTGPIIAGYLGIQQRFRYAVVGDATNVAFHLSSLAAAGRVLISESTVHSVGDALVVLEKGDFQLKRRRRLVKVYEFCSFNESEVSGNPPGK